ncbi:MAG: lycopene cyclase domain-containing protein [Bryobacteraceae bacterium]
MPPWIQVELSLNPYLFGTLLLLAFWVATWVALRISGKRDQIPELWWASLACALLGVTEPLFVPEYWTPPSILKIWRWDLESFFFCFAVGGISAVFTELPVVKDILVRAYFQIELMLRGLLRLVSRATGGLLHASLIDEAPVSRIIPPDQTRIENMLLITFFTGMLGATAHFHLNIIYDSAIVCLASAGMLAWRRPNLRWQILGGGITFTVIYAVILVAVKIYDPHFYDHWNLPALSGIWLLGAPAEEYLFAFTLGILWAPLYEAWKAKS